MEADKPCAVLLRFIGSEYQIWASNPEHEESVVTVTITGATKARIRFYLEKGAMCNNLGRPRCYDSCKGLVAYCGAQDDPLKGM